MRAKTIAGDVSNTVTLGSPQYAASITITGSGLIYPALFGADAIVAPTGLLHCKVLNDGQVVGGTGQAGLYGGQGGVGIDLASAGAVVNDNIVEGGKGGYSYYQGGSGGAGIIFSAGGHLENSGIVAAGAGFSVESMYGSGGNGGLGVQLSGTVHAQNSGTISGGAGGNFYSEEGGPYGAGGAGGVGVLLTGAANLNNSGNIHGGTGGQYAPFGKDGFYYGTGGAGGAGVSLQNGGDISNNGTIIGGRSGGGFSYAGSPGDGIDMRAGGTATNTGVILAGAGGDATYANSTGGGIGVNLANGGMLTNTGTIVAGNGGYSHFGHGGAGGAGVFVSGGTVVTSGTIDGGVGGNGGYGAGGPGDAVQFGAVAATLIVQAGAVFNGDVVANASVADTLVLAGAAPGSLSGFGSVITGFTDINEKSHANWTLDGTISGAGTLSVGRSASLTLTGTITIATLAFAKAGDATVTIRSPGAFSSSVSGFGSGDVIDLEKIKASSLGYANNTLTLYGAHGNVLDTLAFDGKYTQSDFALKADGHGGTNLIYSGSDNVSTLFGESLNIQRVESYGFGHGYSALDGTHIPLLR